MNTNTYGLLLKAMSKIIDEENNFRDGYVYEGLAEDMAKAARLIYDGCLKSSRFMESQA